MSTGGASQAPGGHCRPCVNDAIVRSVRFDDSPERRAPSFGGGGTPGPAVLRARQMTTPVQPRPEAPARTETQMSLNLGSVRAGERPALCGKSIVPGEKWTASNTQLFGGIASSQLELANAKPAKQARPQTTRVG